MYGDSILVSHAQFNVLFLTYRNGHLLCYCPTCALCLAGEAVLLGVLGGELSQSWPLSCGTPTQGPPSPIIVSSILALHENRAVLANVLTVVASPDAFSCL